MKKRVLAVLLTGLLTGSLLAGCGGSGGSGGSTESQTSEAGGASSEASAGATSSGGSVYYLNFKPEADAAWQELAAAYTEQTGVNVQVVTAASGTYSDTLTAEMGKSAPPTIFNIGNAAGMKDWGDYALDLTDTAVFNERVNDDYVLYDESGAPKALGYCYESFGIIVNTKLLEQAGHNLGEIKDIHARAGELGFDAFSAPGLDGSSSWRFSGHLANVPLYYQYKDKGINVGEMPSEITSDYLDNFRNVWDLYITDTATARVTSLRPSLARARLCSIRTATGSSQI